jgi:alpha-mannosidase
MKKIVVHVIPNAHLDPVWLWDYREGLNEGVATCRAMLDLLDDEPGLTFIRGEAAIYEHVRRTDPASYARIKKLIRAGRWEVVGGTWIQPDTNLLESEVLCRHYETGLRYFRETLGVAVKSGWQADSFGHTAGLPDVLAAGGIENFAFSRPNREDFFLKTPAFWWHGRGGAKILGYRAPIGWYGCERDEVPRRFDELIAYAKKSPLRNIGMFVGLGNHGGGPSRRIIADIRRWGAEHPDFEIRFGGLDSFFAALRREVAAPGGPKLSEVRGEMNFCMRGCYSAVARFKHGYRRAEHELLRGERTTALLAHAGLAPAADFSKPWESVLFNSFHDILPGSSIERAFDEQIDEVGGVRHAVRDQTFLALNHLATRVRITLPSVGPDLPKAVPFLVWNPHLRPVQTFVEIEACLDHRPIWKYKDRVDAVPLEIRVGGQRAAFQVIDTEHESFDDLPWRKRVVLPITLPAAGWNVATVAWVEGSASPKYARSTTGRGTSIRNDFYRVSAKPGSGGIQIRHRGRSLFGARGLQLSTLADNWGSWGSMNESAPGLRLTKKIGRWKIARVQVIESGPLRSALVVRLTTANAHADLTFRLCAGVEEVAIDARVFTDLEAARIKLVLPGATTVECEVPAERVKRSVEGEAPMLRWVKVLRRSTAQGPALRSLGEEGFAVASDVLANYDLEGGDLRITLARATRYARAEDLDKSQAWWRPVTDRGELREKLTLLPFNGPVVATAELLSQPPLITLAWENRTGALPITGSLATLTSPDVQLLALKPGPNNRGLDLRVKSYARSTVRPALKLGRKTHRLASVAPGEVATFRITAGSSRKIQLGR